MCLGTFVKFRLKQFILCCKWRMGVLSFYVFMFLSSHVLIFLYTFYFYFNTFEYTSNLSLLAYHLSISSVFLILSVVWTTLNTWDVIHFKMLTKEHHIVAFSFQNFLNILISESTSIVSSVFLLTLTIVILFNFKCDFMIAKCISRIYPCWVRSYDVAGHGYLPDNGCID